MQQLNPILENFPSWAEGTLKPTNNKLTAETKRVKQAFHRAIYTLRRCQLKPYFSDQQLTLFRLLNQSADNAVRRELMDTWDYLHAQFSKYLDERLPLPYPVLAQERERNQAAFAPIREALEQHAVNGKLIAILATVFDFRDLPNGKEVPLAKLAYLRKLAPLLGRCVQKYQKDSPKSGTSDSRPVGINTRASATHSDPLENTIIRLLILQNFNNIDFLVYCADQVDQQVSTDLPLMEQLRGYDALLIHFSVYQQQRDRAFVAGLPGVLDGINTYIRNRVRVLKNMLGLLEDLRSAGLLLAHAEWTLSASQLALFLRILVDKKVIIPQEDKRFFEFVTNHISTPKSEHPSPKAFGNNFYNYPSHHDAKKIYELLVELVKEVKNEYGVAV